MEMNGYLAKEVNRIKSELADVGCRAMYGMSVSELLEKIVSETIAHGGVVERQTPGT